MIKAVVNINIGCYEKIYEPSFENPTWDFYTITDLESREHRNCTGEYFFEPVVIDDEKLDGYSSKRKASYYKAKALTILERETSIDYDLVVVIDGNIQITGNLDDFINEYHGDADLSFPKHPDCKSYIEESQKIKAIQGASRPNHFVEDLELVEETLDDMMRTGFKFTNGYHETGISIRSNTKRTKLFEKAWSKNYLRFATKRDQPSLAFTRWEKKNVSVQTLPMVVREIEVPFAYKSHEYNKK